MKQIIFNRAAFGRRLRNLRSLKEWTQEQLGDTVGLNPESIRSYEAGRSVPKLDGLYLLAQTFSVSMEWLITGKGTLDISTKPEKVSDPINDIRAETESTIQSSSAMFGVEIEYLNVFNEFLSESEMIKKYNISAIELLQVRDALEKGELSADSDILRYITDNLRK